MHSDNRKRIKSVWNLHRKKGERNYSRKNFSEYLHIYFWPHTDEIKAFLKKYIGNEFFAANAKVVRSITNDGRVLRHEIIGKKGSVSVYQKFRSFRGTPLPLGIKIILGTLIGAFSPVFRWYYLSSKEKFVHPMLELNEKRRWAGNELHHRELGEIGLAPKAIVRGDEMIVTKEVIGKHIDDFFLEHLGNHKKIEMIGKKLGAALKKMRTKKRVTTRDMYPENIIVGERHKICFVDGDSTVHFKRGVPAPFKIIEIFGILAALISSFAVHCHSSGNSISVYASSLKSFLRGLMAEIDLMHNEKRMFAKYYQTLYARILFNRLGVLIFLSGMFNSRSLRFAKEMENAVVEVCRENKLI